MTKRQLEIIECTIFLAIYIAVVIWAIYSVTENNVQQAVLDALRGTGS